MYGARFHHGFYCVRVSGIGLRLLCGACFRQKLTLDDAIEVHVLALLEALACV
jgi:hypothetical protein